MTLREKVNPADLSIPQADLIGNRPVSANKSYADYVPPTKIERAFFIAGALTCALLPVALKVLGHNDGTIYSWRPDEPPITHIVNTWDKVAEMGYLGMVMGGAIGSAVYYASTETAVRAKQLFSRSRTQGQLRL